MKATPLPTCRIALLTALLAASCPQAGLGGNVGAASEGRGIVYTFRISSTPLANSRGG